MARGEGIWQAWRGPLRLRSGQTAPPASRASRACDERGAAAAACTGSHRQHGATRTNACHADCAVWGRRPRQLTLTRRLAATDNTAQHGQTPVTQTALSGGAAPPADAHTKTGSHRQHGATRTNACHAALDTRRRDAIRRSSGTHTNSGSHRQQRCRHADCAVWGASTPPADAHAKTGSHRQHGAIRTNARDAALYLWRQLDSPAHAHEHGQPQTPPRHGQCNLASA